MHWITRSATAAVLAVTLAALPLALDQCVTACEAQHAAVTNEPAWHHTSLTTSPVGHTPAPCGHDHSGTIGTAAGSTAGPAASLLAFNSMVAVLVVPAAVAGIAADRSDLTHGPPGSSLSLDTRLLPLRI